MPTQPATPGPAPAGTPTPIHFFDTVNAYQQSAAIQAAVELGLFTAIAEGAATPAAIAQRLGAKERGVRILCDYLTVIGFLTKSRGAYALTAETALFLDRRSPAYVGGITEFLLSPLLTRCFDELAQAVRRGGTAESELGTVAPEHPVWVSFARAMMPMMMPAADAMAAVLAAEASVPLRVLDVAAGHGAFGIAIARRAARAEVTALDWPAVLEVARENARAARVESRFRTLAGSAFEVDWGEEYDLVLLPNFLHHFDGPTCEQLLGKAHAALAPAGRAAILEFVPDEDRVSPPPAATFSLVMLATTPAGDAYTLEELSRMCAAAGFARTEGHALAGSPETLVVARK